MMRNKNIGGAPQALTSRNRRFANRQSGMNIH